MVRSSFRSYVATLPVLAVMTWGCSQLPVGEEDDVPEPQVDASSGGATIVPPIAGQGGMPTVNGGTGGGGVGGGGLGGGGVGGGGGIATGGQGGSVCLSGAVRCGEPTANTLETCVNNAWSTTGSCAHGCSAMSCNACVPAALSCSGGVRRACSSDGKTLTETPCQYGCITGGTDCRECPLDNAIDCPTSTSKRTCSAGRWTATEACASTQICATDKGCACPAEQGKLGDQCFERMGFFMPFNYQGSLSGGFLSLQKITISRAGKLAGFGILSLSSTGRVRMALYREAAGVPSTLVGNSLPNNLITGTMHFAAVDSVSITAGSYWVGAVFESSANLRQDFGTSITYRSAAFAFGSAFPATLGTTTATMPSPFNLYVLIE